jgi:hypothetical protein
VARAAGLPHVASGRCGRAHQDVRLRTAIVVSSRHGGERLASPGGTPRGYGKEGDPVRLNRVDVRTRLHCCGQDGGFVGDEVLRHVIAEGRSPLVALPGFGINLGRNIRPRPHRAPSGDATLAGVAGAVIPDFGVAEERAR